jgi:hypothetical protein
MLQYESAEKSAKLMALWLTEIEPRERNPNRKEQWWTFPRGTQSEGPIMGFFGVRPLIVIGDQPSTSDWLEGFGSRTLFYRTLVKLGVPDAHLTDVIKRRGTSGESCKKLPADFSVHLDLLGREIDIIQPCRIVALGKCAEKLLLDNLPAELGEMVRLAWHFSYGAYGFSKDPAIPPSKYAVGFEKLMRAAIYDGTSNNPLPPRDFGETQRPQERSGNGANRDALQRPPGSRSHRVGELWRRVDAHDSRTVTLNGNTLGTDAPKTVDAFQTIHISLSNRPEMTVGELLAENPKLTRNYVQYLAAGTSKWSSVIALDGMTGDRAPVR